MRRAIQIALVSCVALSAADEPQRIRVTVERQDAASGAWKDVDSALMFGSGDHLRFRMSANYAGYLYVMNHGTSGSDALLFPRSGAGNDNRIEASKEYVVPAGQGWFTVSGPPGQDVVYWLISPVELKPDRKLFPPPSNSTSPSAMRPRCDDSILKARGECSHGDGPLIYELRLSHR